MSRVHTEEPTVTFEDGPVGGTIMSHPAFGQISVSRVSGQAYLYGSDFAHHSYVILRIDRSTLRRDLSNDWPHARDHVIEVALSEAQWATFVSSFGVGSGVQCTLLWEQGIGPVPRLPAPTSRQDQFGKEMQEDFDEAITALDEALAEAKSLGLSKTKLAAITSRIEAARAKLTSSAPFVADQFGEHMENTYEKAKSELHGYATGLFTSAGIAAIAGGTAGPISLPAYRGDSE